MGECNIIVSAYQDQYKCTCVLQRIEKKDRDLSPFQTGNDDTSENEMHSLSVVIFATSQPPEKTFGFRCEDNYSFMK